MSLSETNYTAKNLILINRFVKNPNRYYLEDFFDVLPSLETKPVATQSTSLVTDVPVSGNGGFNAKTGIIRTASESLKPNIAREFKFYNNFIRPNSLIISEVTDTSANINDKATVFGNSSLSVFTHSQEEGTCMVRLYHSANEQRSLSLPAQTYDIGFTIDPQIPTNPNWSISGTNATDSNVNRAQGVFGSGILMSTKSADNDQCILQPKGFGAGGAAMGILGTTEVAVTANSQNTLSIINTTRNPTSYFSIGDPVYLSDGSLIGVLTGIDSTTLTFGENIPFAIDSTGGSKTIHARPENGAYGVSKLWNTDSCLEFETSIRVTNDIANTAWWAGLKETNVGTIGTDKNQAYFFFDPSGSTLKTDTSNKAKLQFIYNEETSSGSNQYISLLPITITKKTIYKLRIVLDSDRKISIFVDSFNYSSVKTNSLKNSTQYSLSTTVISGSNTLGETVSTGTTKSSALALNKHLFPFVGVQMLDVSQKSSYIAVNYVKMSRLIN